MPKLNCRCGFMFNLSSTTEAEYSLVPEKNIENLISVFKAGGITVDNLIDILDENSLPVLICPSCGRVLIEQKDTPRYTSYIKEE